MIKTVESTLEILDFLLKKESVNFSELQLSTEIPKSTLHSILESLVSHDLVTLNEETKLYHLSLRFMHFGEKVKQYQKPLEEIAKPILQKLTNEVNETSFIGISRNFKQIIIGVCEVDSALRATAKAGEHSLMHYTGMGKVLLAAMSEKDVDTYIRMHGLEKKTDNTIVTKTKLMEELRNISEKGYSLDNLEHNKYIRCIGSGIHDSSGTVIAAVSVAGPKDRVSLDRVEEISEKVKKAADRISESIRGLTADAISFS